MPIWSTLGLEKARSQLALLAAQAHAGKSSLITRNGKPYAALVPVATLQREARRGASLLALRGSGADVWRHDAAHAVRKLRDEWA